MEAISSGLTCSIHGNPGSNHTRVSLHLCYTEPHCGTYTKQCRAGFAHNPMIDQPVTLNTEDYHRLWLQAQINLYNTSKCKGCLPNRAFYENLPVKGLQCYQPGVQKFCEYAWRVGSRGMPRPPGIKISCLKWSILHFGGYIWINLQCLVLSFSGTMGWNYKKRLFVPKSVRYWVSSVSREFMCHAQKNPWTSQKFREGWQHWNWGF